MLKEIVEGARPEPGGRRWFASAQADLYVWRDKSGKVSGFEYCFVNGAAEHSLRWNAHGGIEYALIDDGETTPLKNRSPIAVMNGGPDWGQLLRHFRREGRSIEADLYRFVLHALLKAAYSP